MVEERQLESLERKWLHALRDRDVAALDQILHPSFVCAPWSSHGQLLLRREYLAEAERANFKSCEFRPLRIQVVGEFAFVRGQIQCEYHFGDREWKVDLLMTDVWVNRSDGWKALNRDATAVPEQKVAANENESP